MPQSSFLHPKDFTEHGMRPGRHGHREHVTGCTGCTVHMGGSDWPAVNSTRWGGERGQWQPRAGGAGFRQWQWPLGRLLHRAGLGKIGPGGLAWSKNIFWAAGQIRRENLFDFQIPLFI
jgi:hypothetical protein